MKVGLKSFSKNTIIYSIGTIALRFTAFLLIPIYTHYLTKAEFGLLQTLLFTIQVLITINDFGLRSAIVRFFSDYSDNNKLNELIGSSIFIIISNSLLLFLVSYSLPDNAITSLFNIDIIPNILLFTVGAGISQTLSLNILSYFRAGERSTQYMIISISTSFILIILTYLSLAVFNLGITGVLIAQCISFGSMWLITSIIIFFKHGLKIDISTTFKLIKFGFPLIFAMSGDLIINTFGSYQLGFSKGLEDVAIFSLAYKISIITVMVLIGPFQMAYEPYVFNNKDKPELKITISKISIYALLLFSFISLFILIVFRDLIFLIGGTEYSSSYFIIFLLLPGIGSTLFNYIGQSLLHINNKTRVTGTIVLVTTIFSVILTYFCVELWGIFGLVFSINFYLITSSILIFYGGLKEYPITIDYKRLIGILVITILSFIYIYLISGLNTLLFYSLSTLLIFILILWLILGGFFSYKEKQDLKAYVQEFSKRFIK